MTLVHQICSALIERLAGVIGALVGAPVSVQKGTPQMEPRQWVMEIAVEGALRGTCQVGIGHDAAEALTAVITGIDGEVPPASIVDALKEMVSQAISAEMVLLVDAGVQLRPLDVVLREGELAGALVASGIITGVSLTLPVPVHVNASLTAGAQVAAMNPGASQDEAAASNMTAGSRIDLILDIDLPVTVRFGHTEMPIRALARLGLGSVIDLGRSPDDPVEVLVGDRVVARGEVVIVGGNYGVRILDVVAPSERMRTMET